MSYEQLNVPTKINANSDEFRRRVDQLLGPQAQRFRRLWMYYRNPMLPRTIERNEQGSDRPYRQAQEWGLPSRITGFSAATSDIAMASAVEGVARKEVVIENDVAWRIDTMVDFLFGKPITVGSLAPDSARRAQIEQVLNQILTDNGGMALFQQLATLGAVYGFVDVLVKLQPASMGRVAGGGDASRTSAAESASRPPAGEGAIASPAVLDEFPDPGAGGHAPLDAQLTRIARMIRLEVVEPARALPLLSETDWRDVGAYAQVYRVRKTPTTNAGARRKWLSRVLSQLAAVRSTAGSSDDFITITEVITPDRWQRYQDEQLVAEGENSLGEIPLAHIQNLAAPFEYSGVSDVEQLIPLQDELNTRLCDRANRITMQSFKMYLGKGIEAFNELPVAPGRMWMTDNDQADVIEFGGDSSSPAEDAHITELREAMDKISGVTPIAAGAIRNRIGNLTSAAALRVTLMALLAKTERKRSTFADAIARMCELSLAWLDRAGVFQTTPDERRVEVRWPNLLPDSELEQLRQAQIKRDLGVPQDILLRELGYDATPSPPAGEGRGEG